jgi:hypothetical protein
MGRRCKVVRCPTCLGPLNKILKRGTKTRYLWHCLNTNCGAGVVWASAAAAKRARMRDCFNYRFRRMLFSKKQFDWRRHESRVIRLIV